MLTRSEIERYNMRFRLHGCLSLIFGVWAVTDWLTGTWAWGLIWTMLSAFEFLFMWGVSKSYHARRKDEMTVDELFDGLSETDEELLLHRRRRILEETVKRGGPLRPQRNVPPKRTPGQVPKQPVPSQPPEWKCFHPCCDGTRPHTHTVEEIKDLNHQKFLRDVGLPVVPSDRVPPCPPRRRCVIASSSRRRNRCVTRCRRASTSSAG